jgi:PhnB protein
MATLIKNPIEILSPNRYFTPSFNIMEITMPAIPEDFTTLTPTLIVDGAAKAIELYKKAFSAKEVYRMECPESNKIMHACIEIGNSKLFLSDINPNMGAGTPSVSTFYAYIDDVDASFKQAKQAGMQELFAVEDMFWGDRTGSVKDSFGTTWTLATHVRDVSPEEMEEAKKKFGKAA